MKNKKIVVFLTFVGVLSIAFTCFADLYYRMLFERGVFLMESRINPREAVTIFQEIVKRHPYDRYYAARSQFYIGFCYKRMGSNQAFQALQKVITDYPEQTDVVKAAEAELTSLSKPKESPTEQSIEVPQRQIWRGKCVYGMSTLSGDGRYFTYVDFESGDLMLYEIATRTTRRLTHPTGMEAFEEFAEYPKFSPDCRQVAYGWKNKKGSCELRVVGINGSGHRVLLSDVGILSIIPADWTVDGEQILAATTRDDLTTQVVFVSVSDGSVHPIKNMGYQWPDHMRLSPDGRYVAYGLLKDTDSPERDIFLYSIEEKKEAPLVVQTGDDLLQGWTPNGRNIFYTNNQMGTTDMWILSVLEGKPQQPARQIRFDIGQINPVVLTKKGTFYFEVKSGKSTVSSAESSSTEIWAVENFLPEDRKILIVPDDYPTIQAAVSAAGSGDTVSVRKGVYAENVIIAQSLTLQGEDRETTIIDGGGRGNVVHISASHVLVSGFSVRNGEQGVEIKSSLPVHHIALRDIIVTQNTSHGIYSRNSGGYHVIEDCIISKNGGYGLEVHQFSKSHIRNCEAFGNSGSIRVGWSWYVIIEGNKIHHNSSGIGLDSCYYSTVKQNLVYLNKHAGIDFSYISYRNTIKENIVCGHDHGIHILLAWSGFGGHRIFHNDFFDNQQPLIERCEGSVNFQYWDNGYPSGGNYWSDYTGQDADEDGIGDTPHALIGKARDNFPLVKPWNRVQAAIDMDPDRQSLDTKEDWITVYIELPAGLPVEDIEVSTLRLNDTVSPEKKTFFSGDYDNDGIPDMTVKFSRHKVSLVIQSGDDVELTVSGRLKNGLQFEGSHPFKVISK
jgi:nitrous oxidase accessory protein NosD